MSDSRYSVESEKVDKWLVESMIEGILDTDSDPIKVTITDNQTGESESAVGADYETALEKACDKLGISVEDLGEEVG